MVRNVLVVAIMALTAMTAGKALADDPEYLPKNTQKLIATLDAIGMDSNEVHDFIAEANSHVENGYINFAKQDILGGELALRYQLSSSEARQPGIPNSHRLELNYTPDDSNIGISARSDSVLIRYQVKF